MDEIEPVRNFLKEIQGHPDLVYTQAAAAAYQQQQQVVQQVVPVDKQQASLQKQLLKKLALLQELIRDYDREVHDATEFLGAVSETEKKHLRSAWNKIRKTEQEVQELRAQVG
jgi:DNA repair ATPase RecN